MALSWLVLRCVRTPHPTPPGKPCALLHKESMCRTFLLPVPASTPPPGRALPLLRRSRYRAGHVCGAALCLLGLGLLVLTDRASETGRSSTAAAPTCCPPRNPPPTPIRLLPTLRCKNAPLPHPYASLSPACPACCWRCLGPPPVQACTCLPLYTFLCPSWHTTRLHTIAHTHPSCWCGRVPLSQVGPTRCWGTRWCCWGRPSTPHATSLRWAPRKGRGGEVGRLCLHFIACQRLGAAHPSCLWCIVYIQHASQYKPTLGLILGA